MRWQGFILAEKNHLGSSIICINVSAYCDIEPNVPIFARDEAVKHIHGARASIYDLCLAVNDLDVNKLFRELPKELEEAAIIDGCSRMKAFWKVTVPLAAPGMFTTAILVFIAAWNEFLYALSFMTRDEMRTVPPGIAMFPGSMISHGAILRQHQLSLPFR